MTLFFSPPPKRSVDWFVRAQPITTTVNENTTIYFGRMGIELCERENSYHAAQLFFSQLPEKIFLLQALKIWADRASLVCLQTVRL